MPRKVKTESELLGELQRIQPVKFGCWRVISYSFVVYPLLVFAIPMFALKEFVLLILVIPCAVVLFALIYSDFQERNDELRIYQNGFTYQNSKGLQSCLWREVDYFIRGRWNSIKGARKKNGDRILFAYSIQQDIDDLVAGERSKLLQ